MTPLTITLAGRVLPALRYADRNDPPDGWVEGAPDWLWTALVPLGESGRVAAVSINRVGYSGCANYRSREDAEWAWKYGWSYLDIILCATEAEALAQILAWCQPEGSLA